MDEENLVNIVNYAMSFKFGGMSNKELIALGRICNEKDVLELGSMAGMSSYVIGTFANHLDCVDMWENRINTENYFSHDEKQRAVYSKLLMETGDIYEVFLNNCSDLIKSKKIKHYRGKTTDIAKKIKNKKYDIIVFDADHSYKGISEDFYAYENKIKKDGCYVFHDYGDAMWTSIFDFTEEMRIYNRIKLVHKVERIAVFTKNIN